MNAEIPFFIIAFLVHVGIFVSSLQSDRVKKMIQGIAVLLLAYPIVFLGSILEHSVESGFPWLWYFFSGAPFYMPLVSFTVYWRGRKKVNPSP